MKFEATPLSGAFVVSLQRIEDERGSFARSYCAREFAAQGLEPLAAQCNLSSNVRRGTLRGMHYQAEPHQEAKLVRCTRGALWDVIVDLRPGSPTYRRWHGVELSAANALALYVPRGFAHGFQTLLDDTEVFYQMSEFHHAELARGLRWDDPAIGIRWPLPQPLLSPRDRAFELLA
jgi:dTDP-4-dehydrorhamnose 3,5-epimerase